MRRLRIVLALMLLSAFAFAGPSFDGATCAQSCVPPPADLVSWWPGDGDAQDIVGNNDGALVNGATYAAGMVDQAFSFDGIDDYVSIPDDDSLNPTEALTLDAWIYPLSYLGTFDPVIKKAGAGTGQQNGYLLEFSWTADEIQFMVYLDTYGWVTSEREKIPLNTWTHVAGVFDGNYLRLYVNGDEVGDGTNYPDSTIVPSGNELNLAHDPSNSWRWYHGLIDEVEIFDRALNAEEIMAIYQAGSAGKCKSETLTVGIDIMPGSDTNCLKINDHGSVEVAILGDDSFDVSEVDIGTLNFAGLEVLRRGNGAAQCSFEELNNDGIVHLVCRFEDVLDAWAPDDEDTATLTGVLWDGTEFQGSDFYCLR